VTPSAAELPWQAAASRVTAAMAGSAAAARAHPGEDRRGPLPGLSFILYLLLNRIARNQV
jgi:hypothetical protein